jgi:2-isopropylmalate synthase
MHVHAVNKSASSYEHLPPASVGNERRILVSELSGRSNIQALTSKFNLQDNRQVMEKILAEVVRLENLGYQFESADASFDLLSLRCAGRLMPHFERLKYHVEVSAASLELTEPTPVLTEASVKLKVGGKLLHHVAEGDGPVNALDAALRKSLLDFYPSLASMRLVDYKVRVVNSEAGTAARIRVNIESHDENDIWGTIGVSENIIEASWLALVDAFEYKLWKDELASETTKGMASQELLKAST